MPESFSHREGTLFVWTGSATASALVAYVQSVGGNFVRGWMNEPRGDGSYRDAQSGRRMDMQVGSYLTSDFTIQRMFDSATAVHMNFRHANGLGASAGWFLYSGRLDNLSVNGQEGTVVSFSLAAHFNNWSAYGG